MKAYRDWIFDLYGTLADVCTDESPRAFWDACAKDAEAYGARYDGVSLREAYLALCADEVALRAAVLPGVPKALIEPELLNVFCRLLDRDAARAKAYATQFRRRSTKWLRPMPHALETLDALRARGARTFLLSNAQACFTRGELDALGFSHRFDGILLSSDAGMKKPYRGLFGLLFSQYGIDPRTAVMVGNDKIADIAGAHDAGLHSRYFHTWQSGERPDSLPETCREIGDLSDLLN